MNTFRTFLLFFVLLIFNANVQGQNLEQYLSDIKILSSEKFSGRGYVRNGDKVAAEYIASRFEQIGLKPLPGMNSFFQKVAFSVNTFPNEIKVSLDKNTLIPAQDFLIIPDAPPVKGEYSIIKHTNNLKGSRDTTKNKKTFLVIEEKELLELDINYLFEGLYPRLRGLIVLTESKMIWGTSQKQGEHFIIYIQKEKFNDANNISIDCRTEFVPSYTSQNVLGMIPTKKAKGSIFVTAHYDHLGTMGQPIFHGANDNASGIAMLFQLAEHFTQNKIKNYNLVFVGFTGEEAGLLGSYHYTENPIIALNEIRFLLNIDLMGDGKNGIGVVNATIFPKEFEILEQINNENSYFPSIKKRGKAANSDHHFFTEKGVPSFFIYAESQQMAYHSPNDNFENFVPGRFSEMFKLLSGFIKNIQ